MVKVDPKNGTLKDEAKAVAAAGRNGDKVIIHVMPEELPALDAFMKKQFGSKGETNPKTGIREYWSEKGVDGKSGGGVSGSGGATGNGSGGSGGDGGTKDRDNGMRDAAGSNNSGKPSGGKPSPSKDTNRTRGTTLGGKITGVGNLSGDTVEIDKSRGGQDKPPLAGKDDSQADVGKAVDVPALTDEDEVKKKYRMVYASSLPFQPAFAPNIL